MRAVQAGGAVAGVFAGELRRRGKVQRDFRGAGIRRAGRGRKSAAQLHARVAAHERRHQSGTISAAPRRTLPTVIKSAATSAKTKAAPARVLYLYAISPTPERRMHRQSPRKASTASAAVEAIRCRDYLCWVSRVAKSDFADHISERMQDLEWLAAAGLRHQRVVCGDCRPASGVAGAFRNRLSTEASLANHVDERQSAMRAAFARVADADEWGVKIFALAAPKGRATRPPSSGSDYLKRKARNVAAARVEETRSRRLQSSSLR